MVLRLSVWACLLVLVVRVSLCVTMSCRAGCCAGSGRDVCAASSRLLFPLPRRYDVAATGVHMKWIFVGLLVFAGTAHAQSVYKCRDAKGGLVYQSDPCPNAEKRWDASPGQVYGSRSHDSRMSRQEADARIERDRRALRRSSQQPVGGATAVQVPVGTSMCASMKASRDRARALANTHWTFDMASRWDAQVREVCK